MAGTHICKVKRMEENNKQLKEAKPGCPVNVLGWKSVPSAGDQILQVQNEVLYRLINSSFMKRINDEISQ